MNALDRYARKQLLLTRIAFERAELRRDVARVKQSVRLPQMLRAAVGGGLGRSLFGAGSAGSSGWVGLGLTLLRRYRVAAALLSGIAPLLRRRPGRGRNWSRLFKLGALAGAAWFGWRVAVKVRGS